ncbi:endonuclease VII domain-containing protein [Streptomyces sp. NPDC054834]
MSTLGAEKRCSACKRTLPISAFAANRSELDGLQDRCRECGAEACRRGLEAEGMKRACRAVAGRERHLKRHYGPTQADRDASAASRAGLCVIYRMAPAAHVDHCHKTGRVRGVLCFNCNSAIGKLGDDPDAARRAAASLEGISWKPILVAPGVYQLPS